MMFFIIYFNVWRIYNYYVDYLIFAIYAYCFLLSQVFKFERVRSKLVPLCIPPELTVKEMLERVLRLPAVASKRYLTNKVGFLLFFINQYNKNIVHHCTVYAGYCYSFSSSG